MVCMFGVCCQTLDGANVVREARKTIKNARYEENGDEAKKVRERLDAAEKSLMDALSGETRSSESVQNCIIRRHWCSAG